MFSFSHEYSTIPSRGITYDVMNPGGTRRRCCNRWIIDINMKTLKSAVMALKKFFNPMMDSNNHLPRIRESCSIQHTNEMRQSRIYLPWSGRMNLSGDEVFSCTLMKHHTLYRYKYLWGSWEFPDAPTC